MAGGAMSGYCETGRRVIDTMPNSMMISATTQAKMGRSMKKRDRDIRASCGIPALACDRGSATRASTARAAAGAGIGGRALRHGLHRLQARDDQPIPGGQTLVHQPAIAHGARHVDLALFYLAVGVDHERRGVAARVVLNALLRGEHAMRQHALIDDGA